MRTIKMTDSMIVRYSIFIISVAAVNCGTSQKHKETETETTVESEIEGDTTTDSETADSEETDTPSDTDESMPDLPDLCTGQIETKAGIDVMQFPLSGPGTSSYPGIASDPETNDSLFAFAYIENGMPSWEIQTAAYRTSVETEDGGTVYSRALSDITSLSPGDIGSLSPSVVFSPGGFALVWLDGRFNSDCTADNIETCRKDVVFLQADAEGAPIGTLTVLSDAALGNPVARPAVATLPDGFLAVWITLIDSKYHLAAAQLDETGSLSGDPFLLEGDPVDNTTGPSVAVNDETAVIVYTMNRQMGISALVWPHGDFKPADEPLAVSENLAMTQGGVITAGVGGFLTAWTAPVDGKQEVFLRTLDSSGAISGDIERATWVGDNVSDPAAASHDDTYAVAWISAKDNGAEDCAVPEYCAEQVFAAVVDKDGKVAGKAVRLSEDPNDSRNVQLAWDGVGWTAVYETWRLYRWQLFYSQMVCE